MFENYIVVRWVGSSFSSNCTSWSSFSTQCLEKESDSLFGNSARLFKPVQRRGFWNPLCMTHIHEHVLGEKIPNFVEYRGRPSNWPKVTMLAQNNPHFSGQCTGKSCPCMGKCLKMPQFWEITSPLAKKWLSSAWILKHYILLHW